VQNPITARITARAAADQWLADHVADIQAAYAQWDSKRMPYLRRITLLREHIAGLAARLDNDDPFAAMLADILYFDHCRAQRDWRPADRGEQILDELLVVRERAEVTAQPDPTQEQMVATATQNALNALLRAGGAPVH
jgi:hypothetical protein